MYQRGGGEYHVSPSKTFCHTVPKNFVGTLRSIRKFRVSQNFMHKKRISLNSVENFLSHSAEKFRKRILLFLRNFLVSKSFMDEKWGITFFRRKFLVSQCRKVSWASLQCFRKFGISKNFMHNSGITIFRRKFFCLTVHFFLNKKSWQFWTEKKRKTTLLNE